MSRRTAEQASLSGADSVLLDDLRDTVCKAFDVCFELWEKNGAWAPTANLSDPDNPTAPAVSGRLDDADGVIQDACEQAAASLRSVVYSFDAGEHAVFIPLTDEVGVTLVAAGIVAGRDAMLIGRLADMTAELLSARRQIHEARLESVHYIRQVNDDFEELAWLRNLAHHLEYAEVDQPLTAVTEKVLPTLQQLINAESLLFFPVDSCIRQNGNIEECHMPIIFGKKDVDLGECLQIVERYKQPSVSRPIVYNKSFVNPYIEHTYNLNSFALVKVAKSKYAVGYLLALNKIPSIHFQYDQHIGEASETGIHDDSSCIDYNGSEYAFGTIEVGLMQEAGILLAIHDRNRHLFTEQKNLVVGIIRAMINSIDAKDPYTCGHSDRVALMAKRLAREVGLDALSCERIYMTGLLHDVGKIGIPDTVLQKPGRLTDEEFDIIKQHPTIGYHILKHLKPLSYVLPGVLHHHESYDGRGYPAGLKGDNIPLVGRIIAVVDAYDAMTSNRAYRPGMSFDKAESILRENSGIQWDAEIVKCFFAALDDMHAICRRKEEETKQLFSTPDELECSDDDDSIASAVMIGHQES